jgi:FtsH-binding integral membrane protein
MKLLAIDFGQLKGIGPLGFEKTSPSSAVSVFSNFISGLIGVLTIIAVIWAIFTIITGAISIISSGGDKQALESARKKITTGIIGLIIVIVALLIVEVIGYVLGLNGILNIQNLFKLVSGQQ